MTISNTDDPVAGPFEGDDSQTVFPFTFKAFGESDLEVAVRIGGVQSTLTLDVDYSVSLNADQNATPGGTVTYPLSGDPLAVGDKLTISSDLEYTQPVAIPNLSGFYARVVETALDRVTMLIKQASAGLSRSIRLPLSDTGVNTELPSAESRLDRLLVFNPSTGDPEVSTFSGSEVSQAIFASYGIPPVEIQSETQSATAGQTLFTLTGGRSYTVGTGNLRVFVNGLRQYPADYVETSTTSVTFTTGLQAGDEVLFEIGRTIGASMAASSIGYDGKLNYAAGTIGYRLSFELSITDFKLGATDAQAFSAAVAHAHTLISTPAYNDRGVDILIPPGIWDLQGISTVSITRSRIGLIGTGAPGATLIRCNGQVLDIGDYTNTIRVRGVTLANITFFNTDFANTDTCVKQYRTAGTRFDSVQFINWYIDIDSVGATTTIVDKCASDRPNRTVPGLAVIRAQGVDLTLSGSTYSPGGGWHITNNEWNGASSTVDTTYCYLFKSVDGAYLSDNHSSGYAECYGFYPDGTPANRVIVSVRSVNCYVDEPSTFAANPVCVSIKGTVRQTITAADGNNYPSVYNGIQFIGGELRGGYEADYGVLLEVTDGDSWWDYTGGDLDRIYIGGGIEIRQMKKKGVFLKGASAGALVECRAVIDGAVMEANNSDGDGGASDISAECENITINAVTVGPAAASGSDYIILIQTTDAGATDYANPSAVVTNNNLSKATVGAAVRHIQVSNEAGQRVEVHGNSVPDTLRTIEETIPLTTTDATPATPWTHLIQPNTSGYIEVEVHGQGASGARYVVYSWSAAFQRAGGGAALDGGAVTAGRTFKDGTTPAPTFALATNTLTVTVTGVAATTISWSIVVRLRVKG